MSKARVPFVDANTSKRTLVFPISAANVISGKTAKILKMMDTVVKKITASIQLQNMHTYHGSFEAVKANINGNINTKVSGNGGEEKKYSDKKTVIAAMLQIT